MSVQPTTSAKYIIDNLDSACAEYTKAYNLKSLTKSPLDQVLLSLLSDIQKLLSLIEFVELKHPLVYDEIRKSNVQLHIEAGYAVIKKWINYHLSNDEYIDIYVPKEKKWFQAKILELQKKDGTEKNSLLRIHYIGWQKKFDADIDLETTSFVIAPPFTFTKRKKAAVTTKSILNDDGSIDDINASNVPLNIDQTETIKSSQLVDKLDLSEAKSTFKQGGSAVLSDNFGESLITSTPSAVPIEPTPTKSSSKRGKKGTEVDRNDWICSICHFLEAIDGSDLVLCDGPCLRSFHAGCLANAGKQVQHCDQNDKSYCLDCIHGQHICFLCGEQGVDFQDVFKCTFSACGKYYHVKCLQNEPDLVEVQMVESSKVVEVVVRVAERSSVPDEVAEILAAKPSSSSSSFPLEEVNDASSAIKSSSKKGKKRKSSDGAEVECILGVKSKRLTQSYVQWLESREMVVWTFRCPHHFCDTCFPLYRSNDNHLLGELNFCTHCPRAFHTNCIHPSCRFDSVCLVCYKHPSEVMPSQGVEIRKLKQEGSSSHPSLMSLWDQLVLPHEFPDADVVMDNHFKLPLHIKEAVESTPEQWKPITKNDYDSLSKERTVALHRHDVCCDCTGLCDDRCMNRILRIECFSVKNGRDDICHVGPQCSNRVLQSKQYAEVEVFREPNMGWGLRAKSGVSAGSLVIEYLGEIIDFAEVHRRMTLQGQERPSDKDFYIMELDTDLYVDGKYKGNTSRYINHSCDPNCELQRWVVNGLMRIGIFAIRDIQANEALSYDYQFDTNEADTFRCYCGADSCRGTMAPRKKTDRRIEPSRLLLLAEPGGLSLATKAERDTLVEAGRMQERMLSDLARAESEWSRSYTGKMLPGEVISEVKNGPLKSSLQMGRFCGNLLIRNVTKSRNLLKRLQRQRSKKTSEIAAEK